MFRVPLKEKFNLEMDSHSLYLLNNLQDPGSVVQIVIAVVGLPASEGLYPGVLELWSSMVGIPFKCLW